jgi:hypothetical protein
MSDQRAGDAAIIANPADHENPLEGVEDITQDADAEFDDEADEAEKEED